MGYHPTSGWWLIAESKGSDLEQGEKQLANTLAGLLAKEPGARGRVTLRIHIKGDQYDKLLSVGLAGYRLQDGDPFLGSYGEFQIWSYSEIDGIKVPAVKESG